MAAANNSTHADWITTGGNRISYFWHSPSRRRQFGYAVAEDKTTNQTFEYTHVHKNPHDLDEDSVLVKKLLPGQTILRGLHWDPKGMKQQQKHR